MRRTVVTLLTTLAAFAPAAAPARAGGLWCNAWVTAQSDLTEPGSIHDVAVAYWACGDTLGPGSDLRGTFEWWYYDADFRIGVMEGCPTQTYTTPVALTTVVPGAAVTAAECRGPAASPANGESRVVCFDVVVDGRSYWGPSAFGNGICDRVDEGLPWRQGS
ncbi:MAG TPA: hypothetical protein VGX28_16680 [Frankiaceae bacterium]|jgi:hypothetical protein|nr:hypothetical protein [Frankiaceae bacterium]